jgi:hypothetical protein
MKKEMMILGIVLIISLNLISAETNVCCEKTKGGAWCQTTLESECDTSEGYRVTPTSCESTSFCKKGCVLMRTKELYIILLKKFVRMKEEVGKTIVCVVYLHVI